MGHVKPSSEGSFDKPITPVHIDWESEGATKWGEQDMYIYEATVFRRDFNIRWALINELVRFVAEQWHSKGFPTTLLPVVPHASAWLPS